MNDQELDDESLMPWGKYKGAPMEDVPDSYLKWLYNNDLKDTRVKKYIEEYLNYTG